MYLPNKVPLIVDVAHHSQWCTDHLTDLFVGSKILYTRSIEFINSILGILLERLRNFQAYRPWISACPLLEQKSVHLAHHRWTPSKDIII